MDPERLNDDEAEVFAHVRHEGNMEHFNKQEYILYIDKLAKSRQIAEIISSFTEVAEVMAHLQNVVLPQDDDDEEEGLALILDQEQLANFAAEAKEHLKEMSNAEENFEPTVIELEESGKAAWNEMLSYEEELHNHYDFITILISCSCRLHQALTKLEAFYRELLKSLSKELPSTEMHEWTNLPESTQMQVYALSQAIDLLFMIHREDLTIETDSTTEANVHGIEGAIAIVDRFLFQQEVEATPEMRMARAMGRANDFDVEATRKAAAQGDVEAMVELAGAYRNGRVVSEDLGQAKMFYLMAAEKGHAEAQLALARLRMQENPPCTEEALAWATKAAEQGNAEAMTLVGEMHLMGKGVGRNPEKAVEWFKQAAKQGEPRGTNMLGECYREGYGVKQNLAIAGRYFLKAAENNDARAQRNVAQAYAGGQGLPKDEKESFKWFFQAAEQGDGPSQLTVSIYYRDGIGVKADRQKARRWCEKAAESGIPEAKDLLETL